MFCIVTQNINIILPAKIQLSNDVKLYKGAFNKKLFLFIFNFFTCFLQQSEQKITFQRFQIC